MQATILLVDDEPKVIDFVRPFLESEGFRVITAEDGDTAIRLADTEAPDLVVLDWMLPGRSGIEICRALRQNSDVGIIMLTARSEEADKVLGLEVGADDYLVKPFGLRELAARIRAVLRRKNEASGSAHDEVLVRGELLIDEGKVRVLKHQREVALTPTEFKLLVTLARRPGVVYSRLQLMKASVGEEYLNYERTVDTHISHLRQKIEDDPSQPRYIQTVYGMGYRFGEQV
ncbi:response regulator transcription factor [Alicyclobacillus cycloheptanicus]|uniref:DNA-binding response OmpR family regulator n=1 Tax=Alicyclobacillus cycloheptanicus TaxID=1457 RepID=A0ABT9XH15_9BACL|nr:response regulator transcription factor [Alicyclobacillus cycloheptanicus]MDQ0189594.1 DNA-binding response OmpR family regulator [Alicyclobacillus cycloheptanicus]WDL99905.1 response regulator transcription factor [Alicyclobacillus cycloheptanicus]